jgi:predicted ATPase/class 3 adenylate cyclase
VASPPTGTVTFLFTDIEGSTKMWEKSPHAMQRVLSCHDDILRDAIEERGGYVFKTVGDAFCCAFLTAPDALEAALEIQRRLLSSEWEQIGPLRVRMPLHTGAAEERDGDYFGPPVNRVARLLSAAHGAQVLLSLPTQELVRDQLPAGTRLRNLGEHRLKDLYRPERIFQLSAPDLPSEFPSLRTLDAYRNNIPLQPTPLVGREREVGEIVDRVRREEVRLLTLTGPGGTGKTRLALQAGADLLEGFDDGAFFIALATITDPAQVPSAIAGPLGVKESAEQPLLETLKSHLQKKHLLLVIDNFEQVLDGAPIVTELLTTCPKLKVLATSRIPLRLYGEQEYPVPPLVVPDPRALPPLKVLTQYESVRLFVERARAIKPDFAVTNESAPAVAEICARLDGLPLAIELAAARVRVLPPQKMLQRLGDRLKLLRGGARDLPTRQQTLRGTIDWSHELLDEEEKALFARLSVFAGGRTLEAIEEVCDPEGDLDALEGVESLVEKSLLRQEEGSGGAAPRFVMLETVHEYAREKLQESGEAEEVKKHHAEYFLALAEESESGLRGPEAATWLERLEVEHDNLRAALSWALAQEEKEVELGLRLAGALWQFWYLRGYYSEGRRWLESALAKDGRSSAARLKALKAVGWLADDQGDIDRAVAAAEEGLRLSAEAEIQKGAAAPFLRILGSAAYVRGDYERATQLFEESLALSQEVGDEKGVASSLHQLGNVLSDKGDYQRAKAIYEEGLVQFRGLGDTAALARYLVSMGAEYLLQGDRERGARLNEEATELYRKLGSKGGLQYALDNLGWAALMCGDYERAKSLHEESLTLCKAQGDKLVASESLEGLACAAGVEGEVERAARLFGAGEALRQTVGYQHTSRERALREPYLAVARSRMQEAAWVRAWAEGLAMTFDEAVSYALEDEAEA